MIGEDIAKEILKYTDGVKLDSEETKDYDDTTNKVSIGLVDSFYNDTVSYVESIMYRPVSELKDNDKKSVEIAIYKLTAIKFIDKSPHESGTRLDWSRELESEAMKVINNFKAEGLYAL
ncbi:MAG: hypothetical protein ACRC1M_05760 [Methanobacteriaceae archaeon]